MRAPFWSDDFDLDLLRVVPGVEEALGEAADLPLWTYGSVRDGRLSHPSVWNHSLGMVAFFGRSPTGFKPRGYSTNEPLVECTALEMLRDSWVHSSIALVDGAVIWGSSRLQRNFELLMWHERGWRPNPAAEAIKRGVLCDVEEAGRLLAGLRTPA